MIYGLAILDSALDILFIIIFSLVYILYKLGSPIRYVKAFDIINDQIKITYVTQFLFEKTCILPINDISRFAFRRSEWPDLKFPRYNTIITVDNNLNRKAFRVFKNSLSEHTVEEVIFLSNRINGQPEVQ